MAITMPIDRTAANEMTQAVFGGRLERR